MMQRTRSVTRLLFRCVTLAAVGLLLGTQGELRGEQPAPREPPVPKPPAKSAAPATAQPQYKGVFEPVGYPEDIKLLDVFFVSEDEGWVSGNGATILHTTDGGKTWTPQMGGDPQSNEDRISHLQFVDARHGWAYQDGGKLLRTTDGENWEVVNVKFGSYCHYRTYVFTSPNDGVCANGEKIFRSQDSGRTWKQVFSCALKVQFQGMTQNVGCTLETLHFPSASIGYGLSREVAPGQFGVVKTTDNGQTWNVWTVESEVDAKGGDAFFLDENNGYALLGSSRLHKTTDGGKTWTGAGTGTTWWSAISGKRLKFADPEVGWAPYFSNGHHLAWTTDGGKRWNSRPVALPAGTYISGFSFPSRQRAYVVGDHGMIYRYRVVPVTAQVAANAIPAPAMPIKQTAKTAFQEQE